MHFKSAVLPSIVKVKADASGNYPDMHEAFSQEEATRCAASDVQSDVGNLQPYILYPDHR